MCLSLSVLSWGNPHVSMWGVSKKWIENASKGLFSFSLSLHHKRRREMLVQCSISFPLKGELLLFTSLSFSLVGNQSFPISTLIVRTRPHHTFSLPPLIVILTQWESRIAAVSLFFFCCSSSQMYSWLYSLESLKKVTLFWLTDKWRGTRRGEHTQIHNGSWWIVIQFSLLIRFLILILWKSYIS
jgi:hypothetical protein